MDVLLLPFDGSGEKKPAEERANAERPCVPLIEELARVNGRTSLFWTAHGLAQSQKARRIVVACSAEEEESLRPELPDDARFGFEHFEALERIGNKQGGSISEDALEIHAALARVLRRPTVIVSCTQPLLEGKTLDSLIAYVADENLDCALVLVPHTIAQGEWGELVRAPPRLLTEPLHPVFLGVVSPPFLEGALHLVERFAPDVERLNKSGKENF